MNENKVVKPTHLGAAATVPLQSMAVFSGSMVRSRVTALPTRGRLGFKNTGYRVILTGRKSNRSMFNQQIFFQLALGRL